MNARQLSNFTCSWGKKQEGGQNGEKGVDLFFCIPFVYVIANAII